MKISMIAAMALDRIIGSNNAMPWHLPADFAWFKRQTLNKPVIMGRKTFESIGRPLPSRRNIVVTANPDWHADGVEVVGSIEAALALAENTDEVMIIGGGSLYQACLPQADCLYLTFIDAAIAGDTYFPDWGAGWQQAHHESYAADAKNQYSMQFVILNRESHM